MGKLSELSRGRNNNLDLIRLIAAIMVIYSHAFPLCIGSYNGELIVKLTNNKMSAGSMAVAIFIIISGFLITKSYDSSKNLLQYTKARILRIWPGAVVVIVVLTFVVGPIFSSLTLTEYFTHKYTWSYLSNIFMNFKYMTLPGVFENHFNSSVNGSLWTITYELIFYIVVVVLGKFGMLKKKEFSVGLLVIFTYLFLNKDTIFVNNRAFLSVNFLKQFVYLGMFFAMGMVYYCYREYIEITTLGAIIALICFIFGIKYNNADIAFMLFGTYIIMYLAFNGKIVINGFSKYGDLSYGIYIWAFPIQQIYISIFKKDMNPYLNFIISLITVLPIAYVSWNLVEKRFLKLKDKKVFGKSENNGK